MSARRPLHFDAEVDPLSFACPRCQATPAIACRDLHSRARQLPAAPVDRVTGEPLVHSARRWAQRQCPTCHAAPLEPCVTQAGAPARVIHDARLRGGLP